MSDNKDQVIRIVFMGAPSTGKTTIAQKVATHFNTEFVEEYGREYWLKHQVNRLLTQKQLLHIAKEQIRLEEIAAVKANRYLIVDTNALTTWHFAIDYYGEALPELDKLADESKNRFDYVFLCKDDITFEDTWERSGQVKRKAFQDFITHQLEARNTTYHTLSGSVETRFKQVLTCLGVSTD